LLLRKVSPEILKECALAHTVDNAQLEMFNLLMLDSRGRRGRKTTNCLHQSMVMAARRNHVDMLKALLSDARVDPTYNLHYVIKAATEYNAIATLCMLLVDKRADPSANDNVFKGFLLRIIYDVDVSCLCWMPVWINIRIAAAHGFPKVVKLLMRESRVDESGGNNRAFLASIHIKNIETVLAFLDDGRIDLTLNDNEASK
jgi:hypothetical protein